MIPGSANPLLLKSAAAAGGYQIERSLRFNSSDSGFLSRTPASAGNRKTWTWAGWVKRSLLGVNQSLFSSYTGSASDEAYTDFHFADDNTLRFGGWYTAWRNTSQVFRDTSAWYHIVLAVDISNATASERVKLYVNGSQVTAFAAENNPATTSQFAINSTSSHNLGANVYYTSTTQKFSGYLADVHFIDGQALTPSSFTEVSATTGQLIPKAYAGTYTGNSFWLKFNDNSAATATTLGKDSFLLGNNWTPNNLSVTAGAGNDSLVDTPTSYGTDTGAGGEVRGNYATLNPLDNGGTTLSNGNLDVTKAGAGFLSVRGTIGMSSGKWYWEYTRASGSGNNLVVGLAGASANITTYFDISANGYGYRANDGNKTNNNTASSYGASYAAGDVVGIAFDADAGSLTFYKNGSSQGTAFTSLTSGPYFPAVAIAGGDTGSLNFGQRPFAYTAPSGFKALCDTNLGAPVVAKPSTVMDVATWSGDSASSRSITFSQSISPDLVWVKCRSNSAYHGIYDSVRGVNRVIFPNDTLAEINTPGNGYVSAFNSNGFTLTAGSLSSDDTNQSGRTYVGWAWDAGTSTVTNTQGSITSSCRTNQSSGFSVVTYSGTLSAVGSATVGHGLNVAPAMIISKSRNNSGDDNGKWQIRHIGLSSWAHTLAFDTAQAFSQSGNGTLGAPTSTVFDTNYSVGINVSGNNYVAYCFAPVVGYSSFGSYTGNGSSDGPFVFTGFRPKFLMTKRTDSTTNWFLLDTARNTYNAVNSYLMPNSSSAEDANNSTVNTDFLSNGFKLRATTDALNLNGSTYAYAAFAESPFQFSRAR